MENEQIYMWLCWFIDENGEKKTTVSFEASFDEAIQNARRVDSRFNSAKIWEIE